MILNRYIIKSYIAPLVMTFFISLFILLMQRIFVYMDDLVGKGLEITIIMKVFYFFALTMVPLALPLAILLSSIMVFGNLGENYELVALKAAGISLPKIMLPLIFVTATISIGAFFFSNNVLPYASMQIRLTLYEISNKRPEINIKEGVFSRDIEDYIIKIGKKDKKTKELFDIYIWDHKDQSANRKVTYAKSGKLITSDDKRYMIFTLNNGYSYEEVNENSKRADKREHQLLRQKFEEQTIFIPLMDLDNDNIGEDMYKGNYQMMNLWQLADAEDSLSNYFTKRKKSFAKTFYNVSFFKKNIIKKVHPSFRHRTALSKNIKKAEKQIHKQNKTLQKTTDSLPKLKGLGLKFEDSLSVAYTKINVDSVFNALDKKQKKSVLSVSENYARSAKAMLSSTDQEFRAKEKHIRNHKIQWHNKFTLALACLVLFFVGAPLGAIIRKGGLGMPVVVAVVFFIFYYVLSITGKKMVKEGVVEAYQGMWLSTAVLLPLGIFLTYKASNDSPIFSKTAYILFFQKVIGVFKFK